eukprot:2330796-Prymnesium_polylepis.1
MLRAGAPPMLPEDYVMVAGTLFFACALSWYIVRMATGQCHAWHALAAMALYHCRAMLLSTVFLFLYTGGTVTKFLPGGRACRARGRSEPT